MTVTLIPDVEHVIADFLRTDTDLAALNVRIVGKTPESIETSWVRLTQLDAPSDPTSRAEHLVAFYFQFDCYASKDGLDGSPQKEAKLLGRTVRAVLQTLPDTFLLDDVVVTRVRINGDSRIPDTDIEPARERVILTATVWVHG